MLWLDDDRVPRLLRHNVPAVRHLRVHGVRVPLVRRRAGGIGVVVASGGAAALVTGVLSKPRQLEDRLEPRAVSSEGLRTRCQRDEDPEEDCDCRNLQSSASGRNG